MGRYAFGSAEEGASVHVAKGDMCKTKVCPRCGARLFEDMDVCYGCLYDFANPCGAFAGLPDPDGQPPAVEEHACRAQAPTSRPRADSSSTSPSDNLSASPDSEELLKVTYDDPDSTLAFGRNDTYVVRLESPGIKLTLPVGENGLTFGRNPDNDVVLTARTASREHLRLVRRGADIMAFDQGATNPALLNGAAIAGGVKLSCGDAILMGEVGLRLELI